MIIEARHIPAWINSIFMWILSTALAWRFNKLIIRQAKIRPDCSYLLLCNHFSFWDGFWARYLSMHGIQNRAGKGHFYAMVLKKQLKQNRWLRYFGCFSISPLGPSANESIQYAADKLSVPGNVLLIYPQGNLESHYVRQIELKDGISQILNLTKGNVQILWSSNLIEYFESIKPSVYFHMLDCGTNEDFDFTALSQKINQHHTRAMQEHFRFTKEKQ